MKKFVAVLLAGFFAVGSSYFVFADEIAAVNEVADTDSNITEDSEDNIPKKLEQIILDFKNKVQIPEEYSEFEYSISTQRGNDIYNLSWSKKDDGEEDKYFEPISANIDANGNVYYYNNYRNMSDKRIASLQNRKSKSECLEAAQNFLKKILPDNYSEFRVDENEQYGTYFTFRQYKGDIPVRFNYVTINVDSSDLNINSYNFENADCLNADFQSTENIIGLDEAKEKFKTSIDFKPEYVFNYNYRTKEKKTFLAYNLDRISNKSINATDGTLFKRDYYIGYTRETEMADSAKLSSGGEAGNFLSKKEMSEVEKSKNLISKEAAYQTIKDIFPDIFDNDNIESSNLSRDNIDDDKYFWDIQYSNGNARINAKTKELQSFYIYNFNEITKYSDYVDDNEKRTKAEEFIKKFAPDKFDSFEFSEENSSNSTLEYVRIVNGFKFPQNSIRISFDKDNNIINYYIDWYDSVDFENPEKIIESSQIFDKAEECADINTTYEIKGNFDDKDREIILAYSFIDIGNLPPYISAQTGEEISHDGSAYKRIFKAPKSYPDVSGHWCEKYVNALLDNDIYVKREEFLPDEKITKADFLDYCQRYLLDEETRKGFKNNNDFISRKDMADIVVKMLNYSKIAEKNNIFKNTFSDIDESDSKFGYMAICNALDIISADENGNFNPEADVTNAEAAKIIFNIENIRYESIK